VVRPAVDATGFNVKTELGCDAHTIAEGRERFSNQFFVGIRAVHFGGIEERDASFMGGTNDVDLMLNENLDAGSAGGRVGYESASQFSREYSRLFGAPPQRDITRMRLAPVAAAAGARRTGGRSTAGGIGSRHRSTRPALASR
jgi:hypothetical protein